MILPIQPISQRDGRWASRRLGTVDSTTIGSHGCMITAVAMMATYFGHPIFPDQLNDFLNENNLYYDGNLYVSSSITKFFPDIKSDKVIFCETTPAPITDIKKYLDAGKPVVISLLNYGTRHFILAVGYDGDKIYANDSWQGDQVAINDRWGDPASKILQANFFSGSVPDLSQITETVSSAQQLNDQTVINLGSQLGFMEVQAIKSEIVDLRKVKENLENGLQAARDKIAQLEQGQTSTAQPASQQGTFDLQKIKDEITKLLQMKDALTASVQTANDKTNNSSTQPGVPQQESFGSNANTFFDSLKSRKFILSVVGALVPLLNGTFHLGITQDQVITILTPLIAFIGMEGLADAFERGKSLTPKTTV